jgi:hypothetical protein
MPNHQPNSNPSPGVILPQGVAQQRTAQQQMQQQAHAMMINISTGVLCQLVPIEHPPGSTWWRQRRPEESDESYQVRLRAACDETAMLAAQFAESLLNALGVTQRPDAVVPKGGE